MFKKNTSHLQIPLISDLDNLSEKSRKRLEESWAGDFRREVFGRIDEKLYSVLYSDDPSRPNEPVNVLVGLEILKSGFGWTDEEMYEHYLYDVQVRYALGYDNLGEGEFDLRTVYNFRGRLTEHMEEKGENLMEKTFEQITDDQIEAYQLRTGKQRVDSTQIASNIRNMSRLQLLVEVLQRVHRMFDEVDQAQYAQAFEPYLKGSSGQYLYRIKGEDTDSHLQSIGELMQTLVEELSETYQDDPAYQVLTRVFDEHFVVAESQLRPKTGKELSASSLQSPDDWEATYRQKRGKDHVGYVANVTETCDPENDLQLIVKVQVEPNTTDDADMLEEALPELKERTDLDEMHSDGGYNSEGVDEAMQDHEVKHIQTAIRGAKPSKDTLGLAAFDWETDDEGQPQQVTCPHGQTVPVTPGRKEDRYLAHFDQSKCEHCPQVEKCPAAPLKRTPQRALRFSQQQLNVAQRRKLSAEVRASGQNLRAAVEASVRSVKHPFRDGKVPVRGNPRMSMVIIGSAAMSNLRRIHRYEAAKRAEQKKAIEAWKQANHTAKQLLDSSLFPFFSRFRNYLRPWPKFQPFWAFQH